MPSAHALGLGDVRLKLTRPICLTSIFLASSLYCSQAESTPTHLPVTQTVGRLRHLKNMFKSKPIGLVILLAASLVTVITVATIFRWDLLFTGRSSYLEYTEYETQIDWKHSPQAIALELATDCSDYPSKCQLEEVRVFRVASSKAIVVLQERYLVGDSVDASQMRIELLRVGETWEVEWSGMRWRCKPFRGNSPGWTVETCP
jgi:hypothetical protein